MKAHLMYGPCLAVMLAACAPETPDARAQNDAAKTVDLDCAATADALARRGRHLEASFYWEAALHRSGDEHRILPQLFISQIRAGRLRAAKVTLDRLIELHPETRELHEIHNLLIAYTPTPPPQSSEASP